MREELLKKKPAVGPSSSTVVSLTEDFVRANGSESAAGSAHKVGTAERTRSDSSGPSDNDEDDEVIKLETDRRRQFEYRVCSSLFDLDVMK